MRGDGDFFLFPNLSVSFSLFLRCCCCTMLCFLVRTYQVHTNIKRRKSVPYLGYVRTYGMYVTLGIIKSPICNYSILKYVYIYIYI